MFKKAFILTLISGSLSYPLFAQPSLGTQLTIAKIQILKASVEFLASDKKTFTHVKNEGCTNCKGYNDLQKFASENQMTGVSELIAHWKAIPLDTTAQNAKSSLKSYLEHLTDALIIGGQKAQRKQLSTFKDFEAELKRIQSSIVIPVDIAPEKTAAPVGVTLPAPINDSTDAGDSAAGKQTTGSAAGATEVGQDAFLSSKYVVLGEALIIILLAFFLFLKTADLKKIRRLQKNERGNTGEKERRLEQALFTLRGLEAELWELQQRNEELETTVAQLRKVPAVSSAANADAVPADQPKLPPLICSAAPEIKYARYADAVDGFTSTELLAQEDGETIFEITILTPNSAEYRVTANSATQKYALANANYFLSKACKYDNAPSGTIVTDMPGTLKLQGSKWQIIEAAKISFKTVS